jgi:predicted  nucleic acid-binding Zn-ribbon protein
MLGELASADCLTILHSEANTLEYMPTQADKKQVAVRIPLRQKAELESEAAERGVSRSEYMRSILDARHRVGELEERVERKQDRIDELEAQLTERSRVEEKIKNLPEKIQDEESYRERRQRRLDQASLAQRLKWKVTGVPVDEAQESETDR